MSRPDLLKKRRATAPLGEQASPGSTTQPPAQARLQTLPFPDPPPKMAPPPFPKPPPPLPPPNPDAFSLAKPNTQPVVILPDNWLMEPSTATIDTLWSALVLLYQEDDMLRFQAAQVMLHLCPPDLALLEMLPAAFENPRDFLHAYTTTTLLRHPDDPSMAEPQLVTTSVIEQMDDDQTRLAVSTLARSMLCLPLPGITPSKQSSRWQFLQSELLDWIDNTERSEQTNEEFEMCVQQVMGPIPMPSFSMDFLNDEYGSDLDTSTTTSMGMIISREADGYDSQSFEDVDWISEEVVTLGLIEEEDDELEFEGDVSFPIGEIVDIEVTGRIPTTEELTETEELSEDQGHLPEPADDEGEEIFSRFEGSIEREQAADESAFAPIEEKKEAPEERTRDRKADAAPKAGKGAPAKAKKRAAPPRRASRRAEPTSELAKSAPADAKEQAADTSIEAERILDSLDQPSASLPTGVIDFSESLKIPEEAPEIPAPVEAAEEEEQQPPPAPPAPPAPVAPAPQSAPQAQRPVEAPRSSAVARPAAKPAAAPPSAPPPPPPAVSPPPPIGGLLPDLTPPPGESQSQAPSPEFEESGLVPQQPSAPAYPGTAGQADDAWHDDEEFDLDDDFAPDMDVLEPEPETSLPGASMEDDRRGLAGKVEDRLDEDAPIARSGLSRSQQELEEPELSKEEAPSPDLQTSLPQAPEDQLEAVHGGGGRGSLEQDLEQDGVGGRFGGEAIDEYTTPTQTNLPAYPEPVRVEYGGGASPAGPETRRRSDAPTMARPPMPPPESRSFGLGALKWIFLGPLYLLASPFIGVYWLGLKSWQGCRWLFGKGQKKLESKAAEKGVKVFELMLSDNATKPGPIERSIAQSKAFMRKLQKAFGLHIVAWLCAIDAVLEMITEYAHKVLKTWQSLKAKGKKFLRQRNRTLHKAQADDLLLARMQLARLLDLPGFIPEKFVPKLENIEHQMQLNDPTFPLELVLTLRGHLDELKRDVATLPNLKFDLMESVGSSVKATFRSTILPLIPNPFAFLASWKDLFVMAIWMRFTRQDVGSLYIQFLDNYQTTIKLSLEAAAAAEAAAGVTLPPETVSTQHLALFTFESRLMQLLDHPREALSSDEEMDVKKAADETIRSLQRLVQALAFPHRIVSREERSTLELIQEYHLALEQRHLNPHLAIALEEGLGSIIKDSIRSNIYIDQKAGLDDSQNETDTNQELTGETVQDKEMNQAALQCRETEWLQKRKEILMKIEEQMGPWS